MLIVWLSHAKLRQNQICPTSLLRAGWLRSVGFTANLPSELGELRVVCKGGGTFLKNKKVRLWNFEAATAVDFASGPGGQGNLVTISRRHEFILEKGVNLYDTMHHDNQGS